MTQLETSLLVLYELSSKAVLLVVNIEYEWPRCFNEFDYKYGP